MVSRRFLPLSATLFLLITVGLSFLGCSSQKALEVHYESAFEEVHLQEKRLTYLEKVHHYPADRPMVATPDSIITRLRIDARRLRRSQLRDLHHLIENSRFFQLEAVYGAPEGQRYYPYRMEIRLGQDQKEVLFRSNPGFEEMPAPFATIQSYLLELIEQLESGKTP